MFLLKRSNILLIVLVVVFCKTSYAEFPDDPKPCPYGDSDCLLKIINYFIHEKTKGSGDIDLKQIDPIKVARVVIKQGAESAVNIDLTFKDNDIIGFGNSIATRVKGFGKDLTKKHEILIHFKAVSLVGDYTVKGRVLVLPVSGIGKSNTTMIEADMPISFKGVPVEKNGETYMKTKDLRVNFKPTKVLYHFGNLFNGDKELGDNINVFLNENWRDIWNEVNDAVAAALAKVIAQLIDNVFAKYPYKKYFVE